MIKIETMWEEETQTDLGDSMRFVVLFIHFPWMLECLVSKCNYIHVLYFFPSTNQENHRCLYQWKEMPNSLEPSDVFRGEKLCNPHIECVFCGSSWSVLEMHIKCLQRKTLKSNSQLSNSVRARIKALYLHKVNFSLVGLLAYRSECVKRSHTVILLAALRYIWKSNLKMICCLFFCSEVILGCTLNSAKRFHVHPFLFLRHIIFHYNLLQKSFVKKSLHILRW